MVDFWNILPSEFIDKKDFHISNTQMCLAHLVEEGNKYQQKCLSWKKQGNKIVLDDSFYELKKNPTPEWLVKKAKLVNADVLVPFDLPLRPNLRFMTISGIKKIKELGYKGKIMCLVYADNQSFYKDLEQFKILNSIKEVDVLAVPYSFNKDFEFRRPEFLKMIDSKIKKGELKINKPVHLFGINSIKNFEKEIKYEWVKSADSTICFKVGYFKMSLPISISKEPKRPKYFFGISELNEKQKECISYNMKYIKRLLR